MAFDYAKTVVDAETKYGLPNGIYERLLSKGERSGEAAWSPKGAYGYAQLGEAAAKDMDVDRFDPTQNIMGGAHYLRTMYDKFHDWDLAVAHYNAGPGGNINNSETRPYLKRVMGHDMPDSQTADSPVAAGGSMPGVDPKMQAQMDAMFQRGMTKAQEGDKRYGEFLGQYDKGVDQATQEYNAAIHNPIPQPPKPPNTDMAPNGNDYMHNPIGVLQQTLPLMAVFAGGLTRRHAIGAMKAKIGRAHV